MNEPTHKAVSSPDEHEDHLGQNLVTRDHGTIRAWAQARGANPATKGGDSEPGTLPSDLVLDLPEAGEGHEQVSWDRWLEAFDAYDMRFEYREHERNGSVSMFFSLDTSSRDEG